MKVAILTGANGSLGRGFLKTLIKLKYFVYAVDINLNGLKKDKRVKPVRFDITDENKVEDFFKNIKRVSLLVNNAGVGVYTPFENRTAAEFKRVMEVNLLGTFLMSKGAVKSMKKQKHGKIINIGSIYGQVSSDPRIYGKSGRNNSEVYSATKAGIIMMTKYMASHFAPYNIQVNCISPGGVFAHQTKEMMRNYVDKTPAGRMANIKDLQSALKFLVLDGSDYINGQNITIDGGFTAW